VGLNVRQPVPPVGQRLVAFLWTRRVVETSALAQSLYQIPPVVAVVVSIGRDDIGESSGSSGQ
jgi:hypothetical protein